MRFLRSTQLDDPDQETSHVANASVIAADQQYKEALGAEISVVDVFAISQLEPRHVCCVPQRSPRVKAVQNSRSLYCDLQFPPRVFLRVMGQKRAHVCGLYIGRDQSSSTLVSTGD